MSGRRQDIPKQRPEVMRFDDLAGHLQMAESSFYKLTQDGKVPGQKVGRHWRFHREAIDRWLTGKDGEIESSGGAA